MPDDRTVIAMVLNGNSDAYAFLVEKYKAPLYRTALSFLRDPYTAEDVLQDAFIAGFLKLNTLADPGRFFPWMNEIVRRRALNFLSRRRFPLPEEDFTERLEAVPDDAFSPEDVLIHAELRAAVEDAICRLPLALRETARLFFLYGVKQKQIAAHLNVPEGTVKRRIYDAKKRLRKELNTMTEQKKITPGDGFTQRVTEKIAELENYEKIHGSGVGFDAAYRDTLALIGELADKTTADAMAAKATRTAYRTDNDRYYNEAIESALRNNDPLLLADAYISKEYKENGGKTLCNSQAIPDLDSLHDSPEKFAALGRIKFWAYHSALKNEDLDLAEALLSESLHLLREYAHMVGPECGYSTKSDRDAAKYYSNRAYYIAMYANAVAATQAMGKIRYPMYEKDSHFLNVTAEAWRKVGDNRMLIYQPGFGWGGGSGNLHRYATELLYYAGCAGDNWLFPHTTEENVNEVVKEQHRQTPVLQSIVSKDETVLTPSGAYDHCLHIRKTDDQCTYDIWYAPGVGIVRYEEMVRVSEANVYLLESVDIRGGEGYFPTAEGNRWRYVNTTAPEGIDGVEEYTVVRDEEDFAYFAVVCEAGLRKDAPADTPEILLMKADAFVADGNCDKNDYDSYRQVMEQLIMGNKSRESVEIALNALAYLKERKIYAHGHCRFLPSSCNMSTMVKRDDGTICYGECDVHSIDTGRWGTRGDAENRIFGAKPFRFPSMMPGCVWNDAWVPGYTETKRIHWDELDYTLTVEDGGTVTVKAGTFEHCRKITITCEDSTKEGHYYFYQYTYCGTKEYWYAPGVGIVYHKCTWGPAKAECELASYEVVGGEEEYLPVHIGNRWSYEEVNLTREGYVARRDYKVVSGMNGRYLMGDNQMFVYKGTEEEYEAWKRAGCPLPEEK